MVGLAIWFRWPCGGGAGSRVKAGRRAGLCRIGRRAFRPSRAHVRPGTMANDEAAAVAHRLQGHRFAVKPMEAPPRYVASGFGFMRRSAPCAASNDGHDGSERIEAAHGARVAIVAPA